ncbi:MAG: alpha-hydroxy-acid oxidizing protein [Candidatus Sulfotelmatobacter sp.]
MELLGGGVPRLENVVLPGKGPMELIDVASALSKAVVTWDDLRSIREQWSGPIVVKGLLTGNDPRRAVDEGAAAVVVSNHGGRHLDSVSPTLRALPEIVAAVAGLIEVLMDGGIRRGSDIVKALCLGARAVLIGRAYADGLAAGGHLGAFLPLSTIRKERYEVSLTAFSHLRPGCSLCGCCGSASTPIRGQSSSRFHPA